MEKLPFSLFSSEKQISQVFPFCCSCCFFFLVNVHFVHSSLAWFSSVCCPGLKDHVDDEHIKRYREGFFYTDIIIDTLCGGSFLACVLPGAICIKEA